MALLRASILAVITGLACGSSIGTCNAQRDCFTLQFTKRATQKCSAQGGQCEWTVCLTLSTTNGVCGKGADSVSHTCKKSSDTCQTDAVGNFAGSKETTDIKNADTQCQTGPAGGALYFLLKDGDGCAASNPLQVPLASGGNMLCQPRPDSMKSCTGNAAGVECVWKVPLPSCSSPNFSYSTTSTTGTTTSGTSGTMEIATSGTSGASATDCSVYEKVPEDWFVYESGYGPPCTIEQTLDVLNNNNVDCYRVSEACQILRCNQPVPDALKAALPAMTCN